MTNSNRPVMYIRKNRRDVAVIYVRGENEAAQELKCRAFADERDYEVAYVTRNLEDVKSCDVLLVANFSRISRKQMEVVKICNLFKARGIRIESVSEKNYGDVVFTARDVYESIKAFIEEYEKKKLKR